MRFESKDDPTLWINRAKKDYFKEKDTLCTFGSEPVSRVVPEISRVSMIYNGVLLTLCRYVRQDKEQLLVPVNRDETAGWNVPLSAIFKEAIANTAELFPPKIYDLKTSSYIDYSPVGGNDYTFENAGSGSMAAEETDFYEKLPLGAVSGLSLIVTADPLVGDTPVLYPNLMLTLGRAVDSDPTVLICEPGKFFVFDKPDQKALEKYISRYRKRFDTNTPGPKIFKYFRKNRILLNNTSLEDPSVPDIPGKANIPRGSVISAWGDTEYRIELLEWKRNKGKTEEPLM